VAREDQAAAEADHLLAAAQEQAAREDLVAFHQEGLDPKAQCPAQEAAACQDHSSRAAAAEAEDRRGASQGSALLEADRLASAARLEVVLEDHRKDLPGTRAASRTPAAAEAEDRPVRRSSEAAEALPMHRQTSGSEALQAAWAAERQDRSQAAAVAFPEVPFREEVAPVVRVARVASAVARPVHREEAALRFREAGCQRERAQETACAGYSCAAEHTASSTH
jgi:hypothetical protein